MPRLNTLVNLPPAFHATPALAPQYERLRALGELRTTSHDTPDQIRDDLAWADAVIMWSWPVLDEALLDAAGSLRYRGHIDINQKGAQTALKRGVPVSTSRSGFSPAVAEMALTLVLAMLRRTSDHHAAMRRGDERWVRRFPIEVDPCERQLSGRNVGIVGFGAIGRRFAELLAPFRCTLRVCDPYVPEAAIAAVGALRVDLDTLMRDSEIVVLAAASNPGTRHLLGRHQLALLRRDGVLVNVARAALVDTDALVERLEREEIFAAVDVFDKEPLAADHPLRACTRACLTPHRAGGILESAQRIVGWLVDDLEAVLSDRPQRYPLTEAMLPALDA